MSNELSLSSYSFHYKNVISSPTKLWNCILTDEHNFCISHFITGYVMMEPISYKIKNFFESLSS